MRFLTICGILFMTISVKADVYMQNPRGSNNRLDERGRERANANRMFDSQNNNRGGYNVGSLYYYEGSDLAIEWTAQHSCGEANADCQMIVQYMCNDQLRDGAITKTIPDKPQNCQDYDCNSDLEFGMNENFEYYMTCKYTERNKGLFTADQEKGTSQDVDVKNQNMNNRNAAINTRQNPKGTRRAYECPEERDYYPYWRPSPWVDIAIMTNDVSRCAQMRAESQNVKEKWSCVPPPGYLEAMRTNQLNGNQRKLLPLNKEDCEKITYPANTNNTAKWTKAEAHGVPAPDCLQSPKSRDNHNGNGPDGFPNLYNWTIPAAIINEHCALRIRYNISTTDYSNDTTAELNAPNNNAATKVNIGALVGLNENDATERGYVFENNPTVQPLTATIGNQNIGQKLKLELAINTAQYGRTFQDRSHSFAIRTRPEAMKAAKIQNLNVRGKRGNIVQVYPAVEYDFVPNRLEASVGDYVHVQWTGSNTNPNNNDGQGLAGTDRSNIVLLTKQQYPEGEPGKAQPLTEKNGHWGNNYPEHLNGVNFLGLSREQLTDLAVGQPTGQFRGELSELDDAGPYFDLQPQKITSSAVGTYFYMCSRNNNFSNRSQKGKLIVLPTTATAGVIGQGGGSIELGENKGVWISPGATSANVQIRVEEWDEEAGEKLVASKGGEVNMGDDYASGFISVNPYGPLAGGSPVTVKIPVDSDDATIYVSQDLQNWSEVSNVEIDDGVATFSTIEGGAFVARKDDSNSNTIVGAVVGVIVAIVLIVAIVFACRQPKVKAAMSSMTMRNI